MIEKIDIFDFIERLRECDNTITKEELKAFHRYIFGMVRHKMMYLVYQYPEDFFSMLIFNIINPENKRKYSIQYYKRNLSQEVIDTYRYYKSVYFKMPIENK